MTNYLALDSQNYHSYYFSQFAIYYYSHFIYIQFGPIIIIIIFFVIYLYILPVIIIIIIIYFSKMQLILLFVFTGKCKNIQKKIKHRASKSFIELVETLFFKKAYERLIKPKLAYQLLLSYKCFF